MNWLQKFSKWTDDPFNAMLCVAIAGPLAAAMAALAGWRVLSLVLVALTGFMYGYVIHKARVK